MARPPLVRAPEAVSPGSSAAVGLPRVQRFHQGFHPVKWRGPDPLYRWGSCKMAGSSGEGFDVTALRAFLIVGIRTYYILIAQMCKGASDQTKLRDREPVLVGPAAACDQCTPTPRCVQEQFGFVFRLTTLPWPLSCDFTRPRYCLLPLSTLGRQLKYLRKE